MTMTNAYDTAPEGTTATYGRYSHNDPRTGAAQFDQVPVVLGGDIVALILDREDGSIVEWIERTTYWETTQNIATAGRLVVLDSALDDANVVLAIREAELYADCFGQDD